MSELPDPATGEQIPPGWYPDPKMARTQRYWDGQRWSEHVAPAAMHAVGPTRQPFSQGAEVVGWLTAIFMPIVGAIIGIVMLSKGHSRGIAMIILAVGATAYWWDELVSTGAYY